MQCRYSISTSWKGKFVYYLKSGSWDSFNCQNQKEVQTPGTNGQQLVVTDKKSARIELYHSLQKHIIRGDIIFIQHDHKEGQEKKTNRSPAEMPATHFAKGLHRWMRRGKCKCGERCSFNSPIFREAQVLCQRLGNNAGWRQKFQAV